MSVVVVAAGDEGAVLEAAVAAVAEVAPGGVAWTREEGGEPGVVLSYEGVELLVGLGLH